MSMTGFVLDSRIEASSHAVADLELCQVRLQDDARWPWLVLIPRRPGRVEIAELDGEDQARLWAETARAGEAVRAVACALGHPPVKLNHGQLGNVVAQLHLHVVGRWPGDPAWPGPVWGHGAAQAYTADAREAALAAARTGLSAAAA